MDVNIGIRSVMQLVVETPILLIQTEAERQRREAGVIQWIWIEKAGHVYMHVCFSRICRD